MQFGTNDTDDLASDSMQVGLSVIVPSSDVQSDDSDGTRFRYLDERYWSNRHHDDAGANSSQSRSADKY